MAQLILARVGATLGARVLPAALRSVGAALGRAAGAYVGGRIDDALFGEARQVKGPRLTEVHLMGSSEGAGVPAVFGRMRVSGQLIWAARFKETQRTETRRVGGKRGQNVSQTTFSYSLSFAVALCEGVVDEVSRVWANGEAMDLSRVAWRLHPGTEDQAPDPLIEAIEGFGAAPAYRGLAYIVFEDLPLEAFGNGLPSLSFEVRARAPGAPEERLETLVRSVNLIPGAGEFVYADAPVRRQLGPGEETSENVHAESGRADFLVALDQLQRDLPNCTNVNLVVGWFGNDLRAQHCEIRPGVETRDKATAPETWRVAGQDRATAWLISQHNGGPAYGGTPSDQSVIAAIRALKARGIAVTLYPFLFMDVAETNAKPDPYGAAKQAAYPWRGRISGDVAPGLPGTTDKTPAAGAQISAFFGAAAANHFGANGEAVTYTGPIDWRYRRFILHYAKLAAIAGGVDGFILGSELRGLTTLRAGASDYPCTAQLRSLAGEARVMLGAATKLTYAADWSEYFGHQPQDGTGDVHFHLDALWADANIDAVGVDWYPPLADWRDGAGHLDAAIAKNPHDIGYLQSRIEGGEAFEWYYPSAAARQSQTRAPITDGLGEPWIYRAKDLRNWWANAHHNRPGGVRAATPTPWRPGLKPIWLIELGAPAIDKGANQPNLFIDPKSAESARPHFSTGARDDLIQRRMLEAYLRYWAAPGRNPASTEYAGPMLDLPRISLWAYDARPFPAFPARADVWSDGPNWRFGHWLNGRVGASDLAAIVTALCARAGLNDVDAASLRGIVSGFVLDAPFTARSALEALMEVYAFECAEQGGRLVFFHLGEGPVAALSADVAVDEVEPPLTLTRADAAAAPQELRLRFIDPEKDYSLGAVTAIGRDTPGAGAASIDAPMALTGADAMRVAQRLLAGVLAEQDVATLAVGPAALSTEPGDRVSLAAFGQDGVWRVARAVDEGQRRALSLTRDLGPGSAPLAGAAPLAAPVVARARPDVTLLDLPPLPWAEADPRPLAAVRAIPWLGAFELNVGPDAAAATPRALAQEPAMIGLLTAALPPGPIWRWDRAGALAFTFFGPHLESVSPLTALGGRNVFALEKAPGVWEVLAAAEIALTGARSFTARALLRGLYGTEAAAALPAPVGAKLVRLETGLVRLEMQSHEAGAQVSVVAAEPGLGAGDPLNTALAFTWRRASLAPWAPTGLRATRFAGGDVRITWIRRARIGGDGWDGEVPLGEALERYRVEVLAASGAVLRTAEVDQAQWDYPAATQISDFGSLPSAIRLRVAQMSEELGAGGSAESLLQL